MEPECTCNREYDDLEEDEHYISCPVILTPDVLRKLGFDVREANAQSPELIIKRRKHGKSKLAS
jgi:hypothetical protein